jgi:O-antigen/teichoic acid export membrane protein
MSKEPGLGKLTVLYTVGNLASKVIGFALFFVYTYYIDRGTLGYFDLILTSINWITPLVSLQLYDAVLRWTFQSRDEDTLKQIVTGSAVILLISLSLFSVIYFGVVQFFNIKYNLLIFLLIIVQSIYPVVLQLSRGLGKNRTYVFSGILFSIVYMLGTLFTLIVLKLKIEGLLIANIIAVLVVVAYLVIDLGIIKLFNLKHLSKDFNKQMIRYSLPLIPNTLSWWAISTADRFIILYFLGASYNGLFAIAIKFPTMLMMFSSIFNMAWQEKAIKTYENADRDSYYSSTFKTYFTVLFSAIAVLIAISKPIIKIGVQHSYYDSWKLIPFLFLAVGFQSLSSFYGTGYLSSKDTKGALTTTIYGAVITIGANFLLIPVIGLMGSSISMFLGYLTMYIVRVFQTKRYFDIKLPVRELYITMVLILISSLVTFSENIIVLIANVVVMGLFFLYLNKNMIMTMINKYRAKPAKDVALS